MRRELGRVARRCLLRSGIFRFGHKADHGRNYSALTHGLIFNYCQPKRMDGQGGAFYY